MWGVFVQLELLVRREPGGEFQLGGEELSEAVDCFVGEKGEGEQSEEG